MQELAFTDEDSELENVSGSEVDEESPDATDPAALTEAEAAAAAEVPAAQVLELWAQNETTLEQEEWMPRRSLAPGKNW